MNWRELADPRGWLRQRPLDSGSAGKLRAEQFSAVLRHTPALMLANVANALTFVAAYWRTSRFLDALLWAAAIIAIAGYVYLRRRRRPAQMRPSPTPRIERRAFLYALALGCSWAALPVVFFHDASEGGRLLIACLSAGMLCGGAFALASIPAAAMAFAGPIFVGSLATLVAAGGREHMLIAVVLFVYTFVLLRGVLAYSDQLRRRVLTQIETEERAKNRMCRLQASGLDAIGGLASGLAHEVNQPLSAAAAYLDATRRLLRIEPDARPSSPMEALEKATAQIARVKEIVGRLREFILRGESEKTFLKLHELIEEAEETARMGASAAEVKIELRLDAQNDLVFADRVQLMQVLGNLIRNAVDAMATSPARELVVSTSTDESGMIQTDVADTGPGLPQAVKDDLFAPFVTTKSGGMGVGLAISRAIIEAHEGAIWAESNPSGGAVFSFKLPLARQQAA
jgi:signal transduction histidine kinase